MIIRQRCKCAESQWRKEDSVSTGRMCPEALQWGLCQSPIGNLVVHKANNAESIAIIDALLLQYQVYVQLS